MSDNSDTMGDVADHDLEDTNHTNYEDMTYTDHVPVSFTNDAGEIITGILIPIICAFGIAGIIVAVIVLSRKNMCTSTNCYLMALSVTDLLFLLVFSTILADNRFTQHTQSHYFYRMYVTYATYFMHIFLMASIWLTVMLAVERYIAICRPFMATKLCTVVKARLIVLLIYICATICRLPNFWENNIVSSKDGDNTVYYMEPRDLAFNYHYNTIYPWLVDGVLSSIIPFILLLALNARLIWEVRKSTKYLQRIMMISTDTGNTGAGSLAAREELQITVMLIIVVIVFFVCQAPYVIYTAVSSLNMIVSRGFLLFRYVTMLLLALKSAINFLLYCWFSEKFRVTLKHLFCLRCCLDMLGKGEKSRNCNYYNMRRISNINTRDTTM